MIITAGKDCFVKFWHLNSGKPREPKSSQDKDQKEEETKKEKEEKRKPSYDHMNNPWMGIESDSDSDSESENENQLQNRQEIKQPTSQNEERREDVVSEVVEPEPLSGKKENKQKPAKKVPEPESDSEDDDLTGWY